MKEDANPTIELTEVEDGWLVLGAYLESEARLAVLDDIVDRMGASAHDVGEEVLDLANADAVPGYWEIAEVFPFDGSPGRTEARRIHYPVTDCFGFHLVVSDDED